MKSAIFYYSYSGNTRKIAQDLGDYLRLGYEIEILELRAKDESANFLGQCKRAFWHKQAEVELINFDLSPYDLIGLGTPVWAFGPAPSVNTFLNKCSGVGGKKVILFTTYGSGTGNQRCLNYMQNILARKGAKKFKQFSISQMQVNNQEFVISKIKEAGCLE
jgi:flavodoxin